LNDSGRRGADLVIEARDLSVVLGGKQVIDIPYLGVAQNSVTVIIGPNGSGKTTLILAMALLVKASQGGIFYRGKPVASSVEAQKLRRRFAVLFQEPLLMTGTVWDNVSLGLHLRGVARHETRDRVQHWLKRFGVEHLALRQGNKLSGGEAKRVSLARAFVLQPEVLFLDEPFTALDTPTHMALMEEFRTVLQETHVTTVMVTHDRNEALALADHIAVLINGKIVQTGTPVDIFATPSTEEVASFVGVENILCGIVIAQIEGLASIEVDGHSLDAVSEFTSPQNVTVCLRPEDITISIPSQQPATSSARNRIVGSITGTFPIGSQMRVTIDCGFPLIALITKRSFDEIGISVGQQVVASFKASAVHLIKRP
jgi:tungstate transport system ATP-binding protein